MTTDDLSDVEALAREMLDRNRVNAERLTDRYARGLAEGYADGAQMVLERIAARRRAMLAS